jgi:hypothetical protein
LHWTAKHFSGQGTDASKNNGNNFQTVLNWLCGNVFFVYLLFVPCFAESKPASAGKIISTVIPATAQIGNVQVGVTTMEQLETRFGNGRAFTGGHPHGARIVFPGDRLVYLCEWF